MAPADSLELALLHASEDIWRAVYIHSDAVGTEEEEDDLIREWKSRIFGDDDG